MTIVSVISGIALFIGLMASTDSSDSIGALAGLSLVAFCIMFMIIVIFG